MRLRITIIAILIGCFASAQNLSCKDFKKGKFYIPVENEKDTLFVYKSKENTTEKIVVDAEKDLKMYTVHRKLNSQIEWKNEANSGNPTYETIEWINDCDYVLLKDEKKDELNEEDIFINDNGGLVIEKVEIIGRCMKFKSTLKMKDGNEIFAFGKICKE